MKRIILCLAVCMLAGCAGGHITLKEQGSFAAGGTTLVRPGTYDNSKFVGWAEQEENGPVLPRRPCLCAVPDPVPRPPGTRWCLCTDTADRGAVWQTTPERSARLALPR